MKLARTALCLAISALAGASVAAENRPSAFPKGTLSLQTYSTYAGGIDAKEIFYSGALGGSYYVFDNLSLGLEASGYQVTQSPGRNSSMAGLSGVVRHHFLDLDRFTVFADVTFGPVLASDRVPSGGTYFNFATRAGLGATYLLHDHFYLLGGIRYFHLSNARIEGIQRNPSVNGLEGFLGVMWTF